MDIWTTDKLLLFFAFVIPGFISIKCYELLYPAPSRVSSELLVDAIAYSSMNYAILAYPVIYVEKSGFLNQRPWFCYAFYVFVLFVFPVILVFFWRFLLSSDYLQKIVPHPTGKPWDYVFSQRRCYWVKVTLKSGVVIAGKYAEKSFASSAPSAEQIYLEEAWLLNENGAFLREKNQTAGVIIIADDISCIELRDYKE